MCLHESAVGLRPKIFEKIVLRQDEPIEPRRQLRKWPREIRRVENQQRTNHLNPGGSGLGTGADDNVAVAEIEVEPPGAVLVCRQVPDRLVRHATTVDVEHLSTPRDATTGMSTHETRHDDRHRATPDISEVRRAFSSTPPFPVVPFPGGLRSRCG